MIDRDRQGQTGTGRGRQGQTMTDRDRQGQAGTERVHFLRTGIGPELCDFFKKFGWLL